MAAPSLDQAKSQLALLTTQMSAAVAELKSQEKVLFKTKESIADLEKKLYEANAEVEYTSALVQTHAEQTSADLREIQKMIDTCTSMQWRNLTECGYTTIFNHVTIIPLPLFSNPTKFVFRVFQNPMLCVGSPYTVLWFVCARDLLSLETETVSGCCFYILFLTLLYF